MTCLPMTGIKKKENKGQEMCSAAAKTGNLSARTQPPLYQPYQDMHHFHVDFPDAVCISEITPI
jgi:hypothetical protein